MQVPVRVRLVPGGNGKRRTLGVCVRVNASEHAYTHPHTHTQYITPYSRTQTHSSAFCKAHRIGIPLNRKTRSVRVLRVLFLPTCAHDDAGVYRLPLCSHVNPMHLHTNGYENNRNIYISITRSAWLWCVCVCVLPV